MNDIHKRGGTILGTSRGGHDTSKIVDSIQDRGINQASTWKCIIFCFFIYNKHTWCWNHTYFPSTQVYIIGGDGTQKGASVLFEVDKFANLMLSES